MTTLYYMYIWIYPIDLSIICSPDGNLKQSCCAVAISIILEIRSWLWRLRRWFFLTFDFHEESMHWQKWVSLYAPPWKDLSKQGKTKKWLMSVLHESSLNHISPTWRPLRRSDSIQIYTIIYYMTLYKTVYTCVKHTLVLYTYICTHLWDLLYLSWRKSVGSTQIALAKSFACMSGSCSL